MRLLVALVAAVLAWILWTSYPKGSRMRSVAIGLLALAVTTVMDEVIPW